MGYRPGPTETLQDRYEHYRRWAVKKLYDDHKGETEEGITR